MPMEGIVTSKKVEDYLNNKMQINIEVVDAFKVGRIVEKQVVVAKLKNMVQKQIIMENKSKLRGTNIYIESDMTNREKEIQNQIWTLAKIDMAKGEKIRVGYQKIIKQNKVYIWDKNENVLKPKNEQVNPAKN